MAAGASQHPTASATTKAMARLAWERTWIGGKTRPNDFAARDGSELVGRIFRHRTGRIKGTWRWTMTAMGERIDRSLAPACTGYAETEDDAVMLVEETYALCSGTEP
jgi:hypothetical protein